MQGGPWVTPEVLVRHAFATASVVMMNEGHSGMSRCVRTRRVGHAVLRAAHDAGCRVLAMEAFANPRGDGPTVLDGRPEPFGYLAQPEMAALLDLACELGLQLVAYECDDRRAPEALRDNMRDVAFSNWREAEQARHLVEAAAGLGDGRMLVWCGNSHHRKSVGGAWVPMGARYAEFGGPEAFAIDQLATVALHSSYAPMIALDASLRATLDARGGTLGFLAQDPPEGLRVAPGFDAFIASTDNMVA
ncbi:MAG: hypothetical protein AAF721_39475 [Myxococcota bacterium]